MFKDNVCVDMGNSYSYSAGSERISRSSSRKRGEKTQNDTCSQRMNGRLSLPGKFPLWPPRSDLILPKSSVDTLARLLINSDFLITPSWPHFIPI